jgi:ATP-dependent Clp protease ATP-binding subunit ClpC
MFERYTEKARRVIFFARYEASQFGSPFIETEHLLLGILREDKALTNRFLRSHGSVESIRKQIEGRTTVGERMSTSVDLPLNNESKRVLAYAAEEAERLAHRHIGTEHLLLGLLREENCFAAQILKERGLRLSQVREELGRQEHEAIQAPKRPSVVDELSPYLSDLAAQTQPLIGRENELDRLIELLCRLRGKNPLLVGERGVGKRTIVGELARRIANGNIPQLAQKDIVALELPPLRVEEKDGSWHERLDRALIAAAEDGKIFFVNLMHDRLGGISPVTSFQVTDLLLRPIMAGKIQCIGTSEPDSFAKLQAHGHWLAEYFEPIEVAPANEEIAIKVLLGIKGLTRNSTMSLIRTTRLDMPFSAPQDTARRICRVQPSISSMRRAPLPNCSRVHCQRMSLKFRNVFVLSWSESSLLSRITNLRRLAFILRKNKRNVRI